MSGGPIETEYVEFLPDFDRFLGELDADLRTMVATTERQADRAGRQIEQAFLEAAQVSDRALDSIDLDSAGLIAEAHVAAAGMEAALDDVDVDVDRGGRISGAIFAAMRRGFRPEPHLQQLASALPGWAGPVATALSTPLGAGIAAGVIGTALPAISAALTSALLLGVGGGLVGLAAFALRGSEKIKRAWTSAGDTISESLARAAKPLEGPFARSAKLASDLFLRLEPVLNRMFTALAPSIEPFVAALATMVENVMPGLEAAMPGIVVAFEELAKVLPSLGTTLGEFFKILAENQELIRVGINIIVTTANVLLVVLGGTLTFLNDALLQWMAGWRTAYNAVAAAIDGIVAFARELYAGVSGWLDRTRARVGEAVDSMLAFFDRLGRIPGQVGGFFAAMVASVSAWLGAFVDRAAESVRNVGAWFGRLPGMISGFFGAMVAAAAAWLTRLRERVLATVDRVIELVGRIDELPRLVGLFLGRMVGTAATFLLRFVTLVLNSFADSIVGTRRFLSQLPGIVSGYFNRAVDAAQRLLTRLVTTSINGASRALEAIRRGLDALPRIVSGLYDRAVDAASRNLTRLVTACINGATRAMAAIRTGLDRLPELVGGWFSRARDRAADALDRLVNAASSGARQTASAITNGLRDLPGRVGGYFGQMATAARDKIGGVVAAAREIPGKVVGAIGNLGGLLYNAGRSVIQGFIDGIRSKIPDVGGAASDAMHAAGRFLPGSPAELGPFSGMGAPERRGERMAADFARGLAGERSRIAAAARGVTAGLAAASSPAAGGALAGVGGVGRGGMHVENLHVAPVTGRFSLREVYDELTFESRQLYLGTVH